MNLENEVVSYHLKDKSPSPIKDHGAVAPALLEEDKTPEQQENQAPVESDDDIGPVDSDDQAVDSTADGCVGATGRPELSELPLRISVNLDQRDGISPSEGEQLVLLAECSPSGTSPISKLDKLILHPHFSCVLYACMPASAVYTLFLLVFYYNFVTLHTQFT